MSRLADEVHPLDGCYNRALVRNTTYMSMVPRIKVQVLRSLQVKNYIPLRSCLLAKVGAERLAFAPTIVSRPRHNVLNVADSGEVAQESVKTEAKSAMGHTAVAA